MLCSAYAQAGLSIAGRTYRIVGNIMSRLNYKTFVAYHQRLTSSGTMVHVGTLATKVTAEQLL